MRKLIIILFFLFICINANATVPVKNAYTNVPVNVCTPSDSNSNCGSGSGGSTTPGGAQYNVQFFDVSGTVNFFNGNSGFVYKNGNVGIGSVNPNQPLIVNGTVGFTGNLGIGNGEIINPAHAIMLGRDNTIGTGGGNPSTIDTANNIIKGTKQSAEIDYHDNLNLLTANASSSVDFLAHDVNITAGADDVSSMTDGAINISTSSSSTGNGTGKISLTDNNGAGIFIGSSVDGGTRFNPLSTISLNNSDDDLSNESDAHLVFENTTGTQEKMIFSFAGTPVAGWRGDNAGNINYHAPGSQGHQFYSSLSFSNPIMGISATGVEILKGIGAVSSTALEVVGTVKGTNFTGGNGTDSIPTYAFSLFPKTGMRTDGSNGIFFDNNGGLTWSISGASSALLANGGGVLRSGSGTAAAPGLSFFPDGTLGIYKISAQSAMGFSTNGVVKMVLDPNGNLGIGSTAPGMLLDVAGSVRLTGFDLVAGAGSGKVLTSDGGGGGTWQAATGGGSGTVSSGTTNQVAKYTGSTTVGSGIITDNGTNIGIGTTVPGWKLQVNDAANAFITLNNTTGGASTFSGVRFQISSLDRYTAALDQSGNQIYSRFNSSGVFQDNALDLTSTGDAAIGGVAGNPVTAANLIVKQGGNVGIGSVTPGQTLDINGTVRINSTKSSTVPSVMLDINGTVGLGQGATGTVDLLTNSLRRITIDNAGNVGIGTTIPAFELDLKTAGDVRALNINAPSSSTAGVFAVAGAASTDLNSGKAFSVQSSGSSTAQAMFYTNGNYALGDGTNPRDTVFGRSAASTARISSDGTTGAANLIVNGNVGIGTTALANYLSVGTTTNLMTVGSTGAITTVQEDQFPLIRGGGAASSNLQFKSTSGTGTTDSITFVLGTNGATEGVRFQDNSGVINVGIGSASPGATLDVNGTIRSVATGNSYFSNNVGIGTTVNSTLNGALIVSGNVGIGSSNPQAALTIGAGGHIKSNGSAPTVANNDCGTTTQGTVSAGSTDIKGSFVVGTLTVTSCAVTFNTTFGVAPTCITQDDTNILGVKTTTSTTKMTTTATTSMSGDTITYVCFE